MRLTLLVLASLFLSVPTFCRECGEAIPGKHQEAQTIVLSPAFSGHGYYLRAGQFVVFLSPEAVINAAGERAQHVRFTEARNLFEILQKEQPLTRDVDIYEFAVNRQTDFLETTILVAELLESGQATLRNMLHDGMKGAHDINSIKKVSVQIRKSPVSAREFCSSTGEFLVYLVDEVRD